MAHDTGISCSCGLPTGTTELQELREQNKLLLKKIEHLERENDLLKQKQQLNLNLNNNILKRKRSQEEQEQAQGNEKISDTETAENKKAKTIFDKDEHEAVNIENSILKRNGDEASFYSLSDDLLHKINEFTGNSYAVFGLLNKRCKNIYEIDHYKLTKETFLYGYGPLEKIIQLYLKLLFKKDYPRFHECIGWGVFHYNRQDVLEWVIKFDRFQLQNLCLQAICEGRMSMLKDIFSRSAVVPALKDAVNGIESKLCDVATEYGRLEVLELLRSHGFQWDECTIDILDKLDYVDDEHQHVAEFLQANPFEDSDYDDIVNDTTSSDSNSDDELNSEDYASDTDLSFNPNDGDLVPWYEGF